METSSPQLDLTPKHVRAARALLAWSQQDLAKRADVATSTVADFERGHRKPVANNAQAMRAALEAAGVRFLATGAVIGPPIPRMPATEGGGAPVRWVTAEDLATWADRMDGVASLPTLLAHLIKGTSDATELRFPGDESTRYPGWDGLTHADQGSSYVPCGDAGWEIGNQRSGIPQKAKKDYDKRTENPAPLDPGKSTYVFITPRRWDKKRVWADARRKEGPWRDVRVYDADDLVHWIEQTPAAGQWLATRLGKRPSGTRELEEMWEEWSRATKWPLTESLVLSDRDADAVEVLRWLRSNPAALSIQATTTEEGVAFLHATLNMLPQDVAEHYRARCLVATDAAVARTLAGAPPPQILILTEPEPGLAQRLVERGHFVLQVYDDRPTSRGEVRRLARPSREGISSALVDMGIPEPRARALARDSARNLAVLRRLIPSAPGRMPRWTEEMPPKALLAALLAGGWDEAFVADKEKLSELAQEPYDQVVRALVPYVGDLDSPLRKVGSAWRIASPPDAWVLRASFLTAADLNRFEHVAGEVLSTADPRFEVDPNDRWMAALRGIHPAYSDFLRHGVGETLILLALWGEQVKAVPGAATRADAVVRKILENADNRRWWSLSRDFRLLAEASPSAFLGAIEDSLDQDDPPIRVLFGTDEGGVFGAEHLSDLLWALETLAWSPDLLPRVSLVLARLDAVDPGGRSSNRPGNSLREIHLLWFPQTYSTLDQRLRALDLIRKVESNAAWKLMLGILPRGHDTSWPSRHPLWRDFTVGEQEAVTFALVGRGAVAISERLLADVGLSVPRWLTLMGRLGDLAPSCDAALMKLDEAEPRIRDKGERAELCTALRKLLHHHRQFPDADWPLPVVVLERIEQVYQRLLPADPLEQVCWLFQQAPDLPDPSREGWESQERQVEEEQRQAAGEVYRLHGIEGVLGLAKLSPAAGYLGKALFEAGLSDTDLDAILAATLNSDDLGVRDVAHGLIVRTFEERREAWGDALIVKVQAEGWGERALLTVLRALPYKQWTWDRTADAGGTVDEAYWRDAPVFRIDGGGEQLNYAVRKMTAVGRAMDAASLASHTRGAQLPSSLLVEVLTEAVREFADATMNSHGSVRFQHDVVELFELLDERPDVSRDMMASLEWKYLPVLEHSERQPKAVLEALAEQPDLFVQMLSAVFRPSADSGIVEPEPADRDRASVIAQQAFRLLELWNRIPGTQEDGTIDVIALEAWIKKARALAKEIGREEIADDRIGTMLSASPVGKDGIWPAEAVRETIDLFRSKEMIRGFWMGKINRRGVTRRSPGDGGQQERALAAQYREFSRELGYSHPHTAKALDALAESYEGEAKHLDEDVERREWEP